MNMTFVGETQSTPQQALSMMETEARGPQASLRGGFFPMFSAGAPGIRELLGLHREL